MRSRAGRTGHGRVIAEFEPVETGKACRGRGISGATGTRLAGSRSPKTVMPARAGGGASADDRRLESIGKADPPQQFGVDAIGDIVDDHGSVIGWIEMNPERTFAER